MNKTEFIASVAEKSGMTKVQAQKAVAAFIETIADQMKKGERVTILGFGTFSVSERTARQGVNPRTKEKITIPARKAVKFKPGSVLDLGKEMPAPKAKKAKK